MTKTYEQVIKQIDHLKQVADGLRKKEVQGVIDRIRDAIKAYDLSAADLGFRGPGRPKKSAAAAPAAPAAKKTRGRRRGRKAAAGSAAIKFRDDQGRGWVGRGKRPQWLRDALAGGKKLEDFLVK